MNKDTFLKIGLDIGNSGLKIVGKIDEEYIYYNIKSLVSDKSAENTEKVQMLQSKPLFFGVGLPLVTQNKIERMYIKESIFLAVCKVYGENANGRIIKVGIGLPLEDYKNENTRTTFKEDISQISYLEGYYNDEYYTFNVDVDIFAEGFSAFYYLMPELDKKYRWMIVDHGYRTTDAMLVSYTNNKWIVENYATAYRGLLEMYNDIAKQFSFETRNSVFPAEEIEFHLKNDIPVMLKDGSEAYFKNYINSAESTIKYIYNTELAIKFGAAMEGRKILLVGGGSEITDKLLKKSNKEFPQDIMKRLYANAIGFYLQLK